MICYVNRKSVANLKTFEALSSKPYFFYIHTFYIQGIQEKAQPGPQNYPFQRYSVVIEDIVLVLHFNVLVLCALFSAFSDWTIYYPFSHVLIFYLPLIS